MINREEIIFAVDENNNPITPVAREKAHLEGIWHRTTDILVINSKNEILASKRSMLKDTGPGLWDGSFGGHTLAGMESVDSAVQELKEESGLQTAPADLEFIGIAKHIGRKKNNKEFRYVYIYEWNGDFRNLTLEKEEIDQVKWVSVDEVYKNKDNKAEWASMPYIDLLVSKLRDRAKKER